jgi:hypothetical protein
MNISKMQMRNVSTAFSEEHHNCKFKVKYLPDDDTFFFSTLWLKALN